MPSRECGQNLKDGFGLLWKQPHFLGTRPLDSKFNFFKKSILLKVYVSLFLMNIVS